jgi:uncharacterized membrane protein YbaN (DUF454 family)
MARRHRFGSAALSRRLYVVLGHLCVALGVIGLFLPVMPTVVFGIAAAWCYSRGSPALRKRLLAHPKLGPPIRDWEQQRAIALRGKVTGITTVILGFAVSIILFIDALWLRIGMGVLGVGLVVFLLAVKTKR